MTLLALEPGNVQQQAEVAARAGELLRGGGLVVFPTETVYGVAASAASDRGIAALRALRGVEPTAAFTVHLPSPHDARRYADLSHPHLSRLVHKAMPGPIALRIPVGDETAHACLANLGLAAGAADRVYAGGEVGGGERAGEGGGAGGMVGLRCPDDEVALAVLRAAGEPIVAASAGRVGGRAPLTAQDAADAVGDQVDLILDGGRTRYAKGSTVVRVEVDAAVPGPDGLKLHIEREGVFDERTLRRLSRYTLLLVCSGNTCRSPMAEGIARARIAAARGIDPVDLEAAGIRVVSAGVFTTGGSPATGDAVRALHTDGIDLTAHRSRSLSPQLLMEADVVYTMTDAHRRSILDAAPWASDRVHRLSPDGDIEDPIGTDLASYESTAGVIDEAVAARLEELQLVPMAGVRG